MLQLELLQVFINSNIYIYIYIQEIFLRLIISYVVLLCEKIILLSAQYKLLFSLDINGSDDKGMIILMVPYWMDPMIIEEYDEDG